MSSMEALAAALLKTENVALIVLAIGNVAQWLESKAFRKEAREDLKAFSSAVAQSIEKTSEAMRAMERAVLIVAERVRGHE